MSTHNICQIVAIKNNEIVYNDTYNNYKQNDNVHNGDSGNVIYVNTDKSIVISVTATFKPLVFDRVQFIQKYIKPFITE